MPLPGQAGHETWEGDERDAIDRASNVWGFMTVDSAARHRLSAVRRAGLGSLRWRSQGSQPLQQQSLVAVDALTGKYLWHFQVVHHDIWDNDLQAPPVLLDVRARAHVPAVAIVSKNGLLSPRSSHGRADPSGRGTGVPASDVPDEQACRLNRFREAGAARSQQLLARRSRDGDAASSQAFCESWIARIEMRFGGPYLPVGYRTSTINFPGLQGGANWGGASFDPTRRLLFVNTLDMGQVTCSSTGGRTVAGRRGPVSGRFYEPRVGSCASNRRGED